MEVQQARIDSFKKSKRIKNPKKSSSTVTLKWPHPLDFKANPETLADAGFFYNPSYEDPDSVTCYACEKELGGWEVDDDPHMIHWEKCGRTCCWAIVRCGLPNDIDKSGRFAFTDKTRVPAHKLMEKARFDTFNVGKGWIHDQVKNHGANSKMMARAGFVYTPQQSNDDLVTCLYCDISLSGWDANDDPIEEHRRRKNKSAISCPFFSASVSEPAPTRSRSQSTKPPSRSQSKPPTRSTSKSKHQDIILPTKTHDGDPESNSDSSQSTTAAKATAKTPRKERSTSVTRKSSAKTPKGKTRSSSKSSLKNVAEVDEDEEDDPFIAEPIVKKKARSRSKPVVAVEEEALLTAEPAVKKKTRSRSKSKSVARSEPEQTDTEDDIQQRPLRSRSKAKAAEDSEDVPRKIHPKVKASQDDEVAPPKPSRTRYKNEVIESESTTAEVTPQPQLEHEVRIVFSQSKKPKRSLTVEVIQPVKSGLPSVPTDSLVQDVDLLISDIEPEADNHVNPALSTIQRLLAWTPPKDYTPLPNTVSTSTVLETDNQAYAAPPVPQRPLIQTPTDFTPLPSTESNSTALETNNYVYPVPSTTQGPPKNDLILPPNTISLETDNSVPSTSQRPLIQTPPRKFTPPPNTVSKSTVLETDKHAPSAPQRPSIQAPAKDHTSLPITLSKSTVLETENHVHPAPSTSQRPLTQTPPKKDITPLPNTVSTSTVLGTDDHVYPAPSIFRRPLIQTPPKEEFTPLPNTVFTSTVLETDNHVYPAPSARTPPKDPSPPVPKSKAVEPPLIPILSKLPFTPMHELTEAELDMTVEDWIRYQLDVEYDKFRRDGERELQRLRKRAEEVRKAIEGL